MRHTTPPEWVFQHATAAPERPALASPEARLSYGQLAARVSRLAAYLAEAGVGPGERVLLSLPHLPAAAVASLAVQTLGACVVDLSRELGPAALRSVVEQTGARHAIILGADVAAWAKARTEAASCPELASLWLVGPAPATLPPELAARCSAGIDPGGAVAPGRTAPPPPDHTRRSLEAPAQIVFTSGSTGRPRGVVQSFRNVSANTRSIVEYLGLTRRDRALLVLPLFYCYGKSVLHSHLLAGGSVYFEAQSAFPQVLLQSGRREACTGLAGVPLTFELLRRASGAGELHWPGLRYLTQAGGAMARDTVAWTRKAFAPAQLFVMYGQTEATARLSYLPPAMGGAKAGSIGIAIPGVELRVVGEGLTALPPGQVGELVARGENVTAGYLGAPEESRALFLQGWLRTGDLAYRDADGYFFLVGRAKEMLKIAGHRVSPAAIEAALLEHPEVQEAAVTGVPDPLSGEAAAAFVVVRNTAQNRAAPDAPALQRFCRTKLPAYQVPQVVRFVEALPRSPAGKVLKNALVEQLLGSAPGPKGDAP